MDFVHPQWQYGCTGIGSTPLEVSLGTHLLTELELATGVVLGGPPVERMTLPAFHDCHCPKVPALATGVDPDLCGICQNQEFPKGVRFRDSPRGEKKHGVERSKAPDARRHGGSRRATATRLGAFLRRGAGVFFFFFCFSPLVFKGNRAAHRQAPLVFFFWGGPNAGHNGAQIRGVRICDGACVLETLCFQNRLCLWKLQHMPFLCYSSRFGLMSEISAKSRSPNMHLFSQGKEHLEG